MSEELIDITKQDAAFERARELMMHVYMQLQQAMAVAEQGRDKFLTQKLHRQAEDVLAERQRLQAADSTAVTAALLHYRELADKSIEEHVRGRTTRRDRRKKYIPGAAFVRGPIELIDWFKEYTDYMGYNAYWQSIEDLRRYVEQDGTLSSEHSD